MYIWYRRCSAASAHRQEISWDYFNNSNENLTIYLRRRRRYFSVVRTVLRWSAFVRQLCVLVLSLTLRPPFFSITAAHPRMIRKNDVNVRNKKISDSGDFMMIVHSSALYLHGVSSFCPGSWNPSWPSWPWTPLPYVCALRPSCGRFPLVLPS